MPRTPPDDPDTWGDEEWLEWLQEVEDEAPPEPDGHPMRHRRGTVATALGAAMVGLQNAMFGEKETDIVMVVEADGDPPDPEMLDVQLDPEDPDASLVTVRPWLEEHDDATAPRGDATPAERRPEA